jgi:hypothetical protein
MLTFTKTKNTRLPDSVHNAGVTLQSRDIPHTLPSPIFYERALGGLTAVYHKGFSARVFLIIVNCFLNY